ncbi:adenylate/guanylate cyclase domain-containing protein [Bradyrhizobium sp.]|uniref:adenylate/guanylate cyclase domain-containing protein n=1 Tax=Bradyrhizobium sp. TaxID=376 RepID=UPI001DC2C547|nr:adenylate/guanylate cyclase domain-containing protein [Bradyrhizobium sp.]MBV8697648.1 adenylate/guanylate cyclase domain-containing protein [Bradyrhizobium sp.]MBV9980599.1 adenylate/guanylate cyclase domain-containing protein [Bradyrhizobium sp.]
MWRRWRAKWGSIIGSKMSAEFEHALMREVMRSEMVRVKALIITTCMILGALLVVDVFAPTLEQQIWRGRVNPFYGQLLLGAFVLFEFWVHSVISRNLKLGRDVPVIRRYIGAFIETSVPTVVLVLQIQAMGPAEALGFVTPLVYFIFIILSTLRLNFWLSAFTGLVAAVELFAVAMLYQPIGAEQEPELYFHTVRSLVLLGCGILAGAVGVQLRRQFAASIEATTARDRITNLFGQHVSPQVVERLMAEGTTAASDIRHVAVMFVDFRSFTAAARSRSPQDVVDRLDGAFAVLVEILERHGGIVNKFLGDGFLALFGAPFDNADAAEHAVAAARDMISAMDAINESSDWPLRIGIGIHFGEVVAGSIGSPRRKEYTVIGDTVNFASRLEALNKEFNSHLLVSAAVRDALGNACADAKALGDVQIRGYERPVAVWQLA